MEAWWKWWKLRVLLGFELYPLTSMILINIILHSHAESYLYERCDVTFACSREIKHLPLSAENMKLNVTKFHCHFNCGASCSSPAGILTAVRFNQPTSQTFLLTFNTTSVNRIIYCLEQLQNVFFSQFNLTSESKILFCPCIKLIWQRGFWLVFHCFKSYLRIEIFPVREADLSKCPNLALV